MRREHTRHVIIIAFMMLVIAAVFTFVLLNRPAGIAPITTYIPPASEEQTSTPGTQAIAVGQPTGSANSGGSLINTGTGILIAFLIILALLFISYIAIKIAKELRK